jgi:hypothetical protein
MGDEVRIPRLKGERYSRCMEVSLQKEIAADRRIPARERMVRALELGAMCERLAALGRAARGAPAP